MHKLTSSDLAEIEQTLRAMRVDAVEAIRARLDEPGGDQPRSLGSLLGAGDQAVEDMLTDNEIALIRHELAALHEIDAALRRIEFDVGGICLACGAPIPFARLRAMPTATTCMACATARAH
jgi:DnaK suppressor protein